MSMTQVVEAIRNAAQELYRLTIPRYKISRDEMTRLSTELLQAADEIKMVFDVPQPAIRKPLIYLMEKTDKQCHELEHFQVFMVCSRCLFNFNFGSRSIGEGLISYRTHRCQFQLVAGPVPESYAVSNFVTESPR